MEVTPFGVISFGNIPFEVICSTYFISFCLLTTDSITPINYESLFLGSSKAIENICTYLYLECLSEQLTSGMQNMLNHSG